MEDAEWRRFCSQRVRDAMGCGWKCAQRSLMRYRYAWIRQGEGQCEGERWGSEWGGITRRLRGSEAAPKWNLDARAEAPGKRRSRRRWCEGWRRQCEARARQRRRASKSMRKVPSRRRKAPSALAPSPTTWRKPAGPRLRPSKAVIPRAGAATHLETSSSGSLLAARAAFVTITTILCRIPRWPSLSLVSLCWHLWFRLLGWSWIRTNCTFVHKLHRSSGFFWLWTLGRIVVVVHSRSVIWKISRFALPLQI